MSSTLPKYDVFLSFRGPDTRRNFISFLNKELKRKNIRTFKDDQELTSGQIISPELENAIGESKFAVVVVSVNYAASSWCLDELVKIMDFQKKGSLTVMPIFYGVDPCLVRWQIGEVAEQFMKHESRKKDREKVPFWRQALTDLANISGDCSSKWEDDSKLVDDITDRISKELMSTTAARSNGRDLEGIDGHMEALYRLLNLNSNSNSNKSVRVVGIWARGGNGRSALARFVYEEIYKQFQSHFYLDNVKMISKDRDILHLHDEFLVRIQREGLSESRLKNQRVLLVANDVNHLEQLDALAGDFNGFGPGSIVIITTQDRQLLSSYGIDLVHEVKLLRFQKVRELFRQAAFKKREMYAAFESVLSWATYLALEWSGWLGG